MSFLYTGLVDTASLRDSFPETHWSVVSLAADISNPKAQMALEKLCRSYRQPIYAFARRNGVPLHDAQDLTQSFFSHLLITNLIGEAKFEKGRFRSFLLKCFANFSSNEKRRQGAQKRGGGVQFVPLDVESAEDLYVVHLCETDTPETIYERQWALSVLRNSLRRIEAEYRTAGEGQTFDELQLFLQGDSPSRTHAEVAERLGKTKEAVGIAVYRLRKRFGQTLLEELSHTVANFEDIEDELRYLRQIFAG